MYDGGIAKTHDDEPLRSDDVLEGTREATASRIE